MTALTSSPSNPRPPYQVSAYAETTGPNMLCYRVQFIYKEARNTRTLSKTKTTEIKLSWQGTIQLPLPKPANLKHPGIELPKATTLTNWNEREHTITTEEHARTTKPTEKSFEI
ncbi:hypothetical protein D5086_012357 [Populus alba]|uniref:Uncharacterized protein n=1 Tax=Populus alba TaxID=43335 RepID=A0ACC4C204_POPAL